jgi:hypothetical protein
MKTAKLISAIIIITLWSVVMQASKPDTKGKAATSKESTYFVQIPHDPAQCLNFTNEMKGKGDQYLSKYWFGCLEGDHVAYGFIMGTSVDEVRAGLPKDFQANAKIEKVDKLTAQQIENIHKSAK